MNKEKNIIPKDYKSSLNLLETQKAIKLIKDTFEKELSKNLNLTRVSAPLYVLKESGLNDNLNGYEKPVSFTMKKIPNKEIEIIHSLAKWKRLALKKYDFKIHEGLYTDMNAIRKDEELDNLHSSYVDQWDWEQVISDSDRNLEFLKKTVQKISNALYKTKKIIDKKYEFLKEFKLNKKVFFISSQQLENLYPEKSCKEREDLITKKYKTVFIIGIGDTLKSGKKHDDRSPDYDDWNLNGDLLIWYPLLNKAIEISSMGIRVDGKTLDEQLKKALCVERKKLAFHKALLQKKLPLTIGGGIGQSRICMLLLNKAHIGEVQASLWPEKTIKKLAKNNINLL